MASNIILRRSSGGSDPKLNGFLLVNTFRPIWKETEDESPWSALEMPTPARQILQLFDTIDQQVPLCDIPMLTPVSTMMGSRMGMRAAIAEAASVEALVTYK